jgi:hypothetical protein
MRDDVMFQQKLATLKLEGDFDGYAAAMQHQYRLLEMQFQADNTAARVAPGGAAGERIKLSDGQSAGLATLLNMSNKTPGERWKTPDDREKYRENAATIVGTLNDNVKQTVALNRLNTTVSHKLNDGGVSLADVKKNYDSGKPDEAVALGISTVSNNVASILSKEAPGLNTEVLQQLVAGALGSDESVKQALAAEEKDGWFAGGSKPGSALGKVQERLYTHISSKIKQLANGNFTSSQDVEAAKALGFNTTYLLSDTEIDNEMKVLMGIYGVSTIEELQDIYRNGGFLPQGQKQGGPQQMPVSELAMKSVQGGKQPSLGNLTTTDYKSRVNYTGVKSSSIPSQDKAEMRNGTLNLPAHVTEDTAFISSVKGIADAAQGQGFTGLNINSILSLMNLESGGTFLPNVVHVNGNTSSGATGIAQFIPSTAKPVYEKTFGVSLQGASSSQVQQAVASLSRQQQLAMYNTFLQEKLQSVPQVFGLQPNQVTPGHLYAIHLMGATGAKNGWRAGSNSANQNPAFANKGADTSGSDVAKKFNDVYLAKRLERK